MRNLQKNQARKDHEETDNMRDEIANLEGMVLHKKYSFVRFWSARVNHFLSGWEIIINLKWSNIKYNLYKIKLLIDNKDILYVNNKLNKNIINNNVDIKIIRILKDPFSLYKYLYSVSDYIKWSTYIFNLLPLLFINNINIVKNDIINLSDILYHIINIKEQNLTNSKYLHLINLCKKNKKLVIYNKKFNINIKSEYLFNYNINLGYLVKHIYMKDHIINISKPKTIEDKLKYKLKLTNKKYKKCKKQLEKLRLTITESNINTSTIYNEIKE